MATPDTSIQLTRRDRLLVVAAGLLAGFYVLGVMGDLFLQVTSQTIGGLWEGRALEHLGILLWVPAFTVAAAAFLAHGRRRQQGLAGAALLGAFSSLASLAGGIQVAVDSHNLGAGGSLLASDYLSAAGALLMVLALWIAYRAFSASARSPDLWQERDRQLLPAAVVMAGAYLLSAASAAFMLGLAGGDGLETAALWLGVASPLLFTVGVAIAASALRPEQGPFLSPESVVRTRRDRTLGASASVIAFGFLLEGLDVALELVDLLRSEPFGQGETGLAITVLGSLVGVGAAVYIAAAMRRPPATL